MRGGGVAALIDRRLVLAGGLACTAGCRPSVRPSPAPSAGPPGRIVSLNPCVDTILVRVADRNQIAALSHYSRRAEGSTIAATARGLPFTHGTAEEVILLEPDLVFSGRPSPLAVLGALDRLGVPTALFPVPETVGDSLAQVVEVAERVGHPARGVALARRIEAAIAAAAPPTGARPVSALVFMPGGFVSAPGTLMDEMMRRAGLENVARRYGLTQSMSLPLERLIADPPEVLLSGEARPGAPSWAERVLEHPALDAVSRDLVRAVFPQRLLFCGGPVLMQTAVVLRRAREAALARRA